MHRANNFLDSVPFSPYNIALLEVFGNLFSRLLCTQRELADVDVVSTPMKRISRGLPFETRGYQKNDETRRVLEV